MANYTPNLNLFEPGTDDNLGIESTLKDNFDAIDSKVGNALTDVANKKWNSLGERLNDEQTKSDAAKTDVDYLKTKGVNALLNNHFFRCINLRGAPTCPENTLAGYRYAVEHGFWGVYGDVQLTSDKVWMMFQDLDVSTKTNGTGTFISKTQTQVKALDCGTKFHTAWAGEQIPDLADFMLNCRSTQSIPFLNIVGAYVDLDIKSLVDVIKQWDVINDSVIVSNQLTNLQRVRLYDKTVAVGLYVTSHSLTTLTDIAALGNSFALYTDDQVTKDNMKAAEDKAVPVVAYMVTDNNQRMREIISFGLRGAVTRKTPAVRGV